MIYIRNCSIPSVPTGQVHRSKSQVGWTAIFAHLRQKGYSTVKLPSGKPRTYLTKLQLAKLKTLHVRN